MSLLANVDYLAGTEGVVALLIGTPRIDVPEQPLVFRGLVRWQPILQSATQLLTITGEVSIRLVIAHHTLILQKEQDQFVGVVFPTGHAVAKSLRRMIRRMAKRQRISPRKPREARAAQEAVASAMQVPPANSLHPSQHSRSQPLASSSSPFNSRNSLPLAPRMGNPSR